MQNKKQTRLTVDAKQVLSVEFANNDDDDDDDDETTADDGREEEGRRTT